MTPGTTSRSVGAAPTCDTDIPGTSVCPTIRRFSSSDHRRRVRVRPAIEQLHRVHLSVVDTYSHLPTFKTGTAGELLARAGGPTVPCFAK